MRTQVHELSRRLEQCLSGREWFEAQALPEICEEMSEMIEDLAQSTISGLAGAPTAAGSITGILAEIHREMSGANSVRLRGDSKNMLMEVDGCPNLGWCFGNAKRICVPDLVVAALIQRILETPVDLSVDRRQRTCRHEYRPAWLAQLLSELAEYGAEGMVVLRGEKVIFSHVPTDEDARALSESVMIKEESVAGVPPNRDIYCHNRKIMMMRLGGVFVSVCLRAEGANETEIRERVQRAVVSPR